jgi:2-iminobutanoate/2-iminopropanoate deaminase
MRISFALAAFAVLSAAAMPTAASAQTFEKKNYNYSEWTKGRFSEAVQSSAPAR